MSADLIVPALILLAGIVWASRGGTNPLQQWVDLHDSRRQPLPPARPRVAAEPRRPANLWPVQPRAIDWVDGVLVDDVPTGLPALTADSEIVIEGHVVEPVTPAPARAALPRRPRAIEPGRPAIEPPRDQR